MDVHLGDNKKKILFVLRTSKTHWTDNRPQFIKITSIPMANVQGYSDYPSSNCIHHMLPRTNSFKFCPYDLVKRYMDMQKNYRSPSEPFYVFRDHSLVTPQHARTTLRQMLSGMQLKAEKYGMHSFHIGRSVDMYNSSIETGIIKKVGRWKSNIVYSYLNY